MEATSDVPGRTDGRSLQLVRPVRIDLGNGLEQEDRDRWTDDPRGEDLRDDSDLWVTLLRLSYDLDANESGGIFGSLHGLRCLGARLERTLWGVRLAPGRMSRAQYGALRQRYLLPWSATIETLLGKVAAEHPEIEEKGISVGPLRSSLADAGAHGRKGRTRSPAP